MHKPIAEEFDATAPYVKYYELNFKTSPVVLVPAITLLYTRVTLS